MQGGQVAIKKPTADLTPFSIGRNVSTSFLGRIFDVESDFAQDFLRVILGE